MEPAGRSPKPLFENDLALMPQCREMAYESSRATLWLYLRSERLRLPSGRDASRYVTLAGTPATITTRIGSTALLRVV
jgi:hypothetical protein